MRPQVDEINVLEAEIEPLSGDELRSRVAEMRQSIDNGESLDAMLPRAFAIVREAAKRTLGQRHYDVQMIGGMVLHQGRIAEMKTGEGKTLVATLPSFLNALTGKGVHVVTVNDYLAKRDAEWMGAVHRYLGLSVGCIVHGITDEERRAAYRADIAYGQNNEFGFDYLRDNMKPSLDMYVQRDPHYAIVDEVDSILIDEARTPLIISGPVDDDPEKFRRIDKVIPRLKVEEHFTVDEKARSATLTDDGIVLVEKLLEIDNLYAPEEMETLHVVNNGLRAHSLYSRDVDYVVKDNQVMIVDEFTGRLMEGRRWSDGLHQAVEAKEKVRIQNESQTYASITFQNYFRMYEKLSGMTGTADTEAPEFAKIYGLDVVVIPTNKPMARDDRDDLVYRTRDEKWNAVAKEIAENHKLGQPALVGTVAIETSELLSKKLKTKGVPHNILNAKQHQREAEIIAQAGRLGSVTISTNMAGRGTDIVLGGNAEMMMKARGMDPEDPENKDELEKLQVQCAAEREKVLEAGGLHVLGTERHESRRIDNQLRGRAGRQGDPGSSRFHLSLEDDLLRIFGGDRFQAVMNRLWGDEGEAIEAKMLSGAIERAQAKVEARNFDIRKHLLDYDDVMNKQRESIYSWRRNILGGDMLEDMYREMASELMEEILEATVPERGASDLETLEQVVQQQFMIDLRAAGVVGDGEPTRAEVKTKLSELIDQRIEEKRAMVREIREKAAHLNPPDFDYFARTVLIQTLDQQWKDHLLAMDHLKEGIGLRGYGQRDPKIEYQREGFQLFLAMDRRIRASAVEQLFRMVLQVPDEEQMRRQRMQEEARQQQLDRLSERHSSESAPEPGQQTVVRDQPKVGRNEPCPCGSGKKYKKCHGKAT